MNIPFEAPGRATAEVDKILTFHWQQRIIGKAERQTKGQPLL